MLRAANSLAILVLVGTGLGFAASAWGQGDGSRTDNPDLLRGALGAGCMPGTLCHFPSPDHAPPLVLPPQPVSAPVPEPVVPPAIQQPFPAPVASSSPGSAGDFGYGISLRGAYVRSGTHERFEMLAIPEVSFSRAAGATDFTVDASATIVGPQSGDPRVGAGDVSAGVVHRLSPSAGLAFDAGLAFSQDDPAGLSVTESGLAEAPANVAGRLDAAYFQTLGRLNAAGRLGLERQWTGTSRRADGAEIDHAHESFTRYDGALRLGYQLTPVLEVFGEGSAGRTEFDAVDPDLGASRTGTDYALRGGIAANWQDVVTLEASVGSGWRDYDASVIGDAQSWLYGAAIGWRPNATTTLTASLDTELTPGEGATGASTAYRAGLAAAYTANSWLGLRASAGLEWTVPEDGSPTSRLYSAGFGADFVIGPHTTATLDYGYGLREDPAAAEPSRDEHRVSGGISLRY